MQLWKTEFCFGLVIVSGHRNCKSSASPSPTHNNSW